MHMGAHGCTWVHVHLGSLLEPLELLGCIDSDGRFEESLERIVRGGGSRRGTRGGTGSQPQLGGASITCT